MSDLIDRERFSADMRDFQNRVGIWRDEAEDMETRTRADAALATIIETKLILDKQPTIPAPCWHRVEDELPKESNCYIVYLRQGTEMKTPEWMGGEPLSYVTEMGFDKEQMLWKDGHDAYNAVLSAVDTKKDFHVTHWTERPEPPKEDA